MTKDLASENQIRAVIEDAYSVFIGCEISIGLIGNAYRIMVKDTFDVWHTLNVPFDNMRKAINSLQPKETA